jgi:hypothetical protein
MHFADVLLLLSLPYRAIVVFGPKGNWQYHRTEWCSRIILDDTVEGSLGGGEHLGDVQPHLLQCTHGAQVEAAPTIDEYSGQL